MKKTTYQAPEMETVELKNQTTLLAGSGGKIEYDNDSNFNNDGDPVINPPA